jgi:hypothetical protein
MLLSLLALISGFLCTFNLLLIVVLGTYTVDHLIHALCVLSNLILIVCTKEYKQMDTRDPVLTEDSILREKLQVLKWVSLLTKAAAFHRIKKVLDCRERTRYRQLKRCQSDQSPFRSNECGPTNSKVW